MKLQTTLILLAATIVSLQTSAQGIKFTEGSFAEVKAKAKKENKLIFVDTYAEWCGPCKWMAKNVFTNDTVGKFYNEKFINYTLDIEKGEGVAFAKDNKINSVPTLFYLDSTGRMLHKAVGAKDVKAFVALGEKALNPEQRLTAWQDKYSSGKREPEFIRPYLDELADAGINQEKTEIILWYFYALPEKEWLTKENFEVINKHCYNSEKQGFQYLLKNREKFYTVVDKEKVNNKIKEVLSSSWRNAIDWKETNGNWKPSINEDKYKAAIAQIQNSGLEQTDELLLEANINYFEIKGDWKKYMELQDTYIKKYKMNDQNYLNNMAWGIYENEKITDKESLQKALTWIKHSVELNSNYYNNDTQAAIFYKMGNKKDAAKTAEKAIALAKKDGVDAKATEELLKKIKEGK